jgi:hypothetical protein
LEVDYNSPINKKQKPFKKEVFMLFLEIFLTVTAWNRGFKAWALLPLAFAVILGFTIGAANPGAVADNDIFSLIWIDILAVIALGIMSAVGRNSEERVATEDAHEVQGTGAELPEH